MALQRQWHKREAVTSNDGTGARVGREDQNLVARLAGGYRAFKKVGAKEAVFGTDVQQTAVIVGCRRARSR